MPLQPGYNIVTERVEETDAEYGALEFFRAAAANDDLPARVTVMGIGDLLYYVSENDRANGISTLRKVLRETASVDQFSAVQFLIDGRLSPANRFQIRIERQGEAVILDIGELFVGEPDMVSATHAVTPK